MGILFGVNLPSNNQQYDKTNDRARGEPIQSSVRQHAATTAKVRRLGYSKGIKSMTAYNTPPLDNFRNTTDPNDDYVTVLASYK